MRALARSHQFILVGLLTCALPRTQHGMPEPAHFPELGLTVQLPALHQLEQVPSDQSWVRARWRGTLDEHEFEMSLLQLDESYNEPAEAAAVVVDHVRRQGNQLDVTAQEVHEGAYGHASFAIAVRADQRLPERADVAGTHIILAGLLPDGAYGLHVACRPRADEAADRVIRAFLRDGISYDGPRRDPRWSTAEVRARWLRDAPEELHAAFLRALKSRETSHKAVVRTEHYIVLTNSSGGRKFGQEMERNYRQIAATFPFPEVEGRRLMPIFLFRTPEQYYEFYANITGLSQDEVRRSKGHAWRDYYATWYEAPGDPVHIHEATHQIFENRLGFDGGGSWFQEGVAEYVETSRNDRNVAASLVKRGKHIPLRELIALESLLYATEDAHASYRQAALLIEFLRESRFGRDGFPMFMRLVGRALDGDVERIEEVCMQVYGVSIDGLDEKFREYCARR